MTFARLTYSIDGRDRIIQLSPSWDEAIENEGSAELRRENIIGKNFWSFIDQDIIPLYQEVIRLVREKKKAFSFNYRCDSPEEKKFMLLQVAPEDNEGIIFTSSLIKAEKNQSCLYFLHRKMGHKANLFLCSICNKVKVQDKWVETAVALGQGLLEQDAFYRRINSICSPCQTSIKDQLSSFRKG